MNGIIVIDKPQDWTSMDVCSKLRKLIKERRIGHSGTLDPLATGVLTVFVGRATRAVEFAESDKKEYYATLKLGIETDTQDITGNILNVSENIPTRQDLENILEQFRGTILQVPPMYSALKYKGKKLYELARVGKTIEREPRKIEIYRLDILEQISDSEYKIVIGCSKGTYIRTLCNDIGKALNCYGVMTALRRTKAGIFTLSDALCLEQVEEYVNNGTINQYLRPIDSIFAEYPQIKIYGIKEKLCRNGTAFNLKGDDGTYRFYGENGEFLMLGERKDNVVYTIKNFF